jgi:predicted flap endonuclease-1-like 5' DNA nuclease
MPLPTPVPSHAPASTNPNAELEQTKRVLSSKLLELRKFQAERETLLARLAERDARIHELERASPDEAERLRARVKDLEAQLERLRQDRDRARAHAGDLEARLDKTEQIDPDLPHLMEELREAKARITELETAIAERDANIARLEQDLTDNLSWEPPPFDDLKRIPGIGPKYEQALHALGVRTFAQIAAWTEDDIETFAKKLKVHKTRMEKADWVGKAKELVGKQGT